MVHIDSVSLNAAMCCRHQTDSEVSRSRFTKAMMLVVMIREMIDILNNATNNHLDTLQEL